ncbi:Zinc transporter ZIP6 [Halotydeus destructor]|nr:Zinc transporter ZIP6 [Halotydeus destructor]
MATEVDTDVFTLWLYGSGSVLLISVFGLMAIMSIPLVQSHHHGNVLQLLVGLAIGTLTSDALLHLLPHAFMGEGHQETGEDHGHDHHDDNNHSHVGKIHSEHSHEKTVQYGLMALMGIIGFLTFERVVTIVSDLCNKSSHKTKVGSSSCNNRAPSTEHSGHGCHAEALMPEKEKLHNEPVKMIDDKPKNNCMHHDTVDVAMIGGNELAVTTEQCHIETVVCQHPDSDRGFVVQLTDHHHHHQHQSGQKGAKSVIYTIVTGDGLHNMMDGLAIGIAFAGGIGGGLSTSIAVLCHELPHEVGDFAVLLKAGLSVKKAVLYNTLSAFLCFIGMTLGVFIGNMDTNMLSSIIAGMFLYIALVDMIPQLDCCPTSSGPTRALKLSIQLLGISIGVAIMSIISIYEPTLQKMFESS